MFSRSGHQHHKLGMPAQDIAAVHGDGLFGEITGVTLPLPQYHLAPGVLLHRGLRLGNLKPPGLLFHVAIEHEEFEFTSPRIDRPANGGYFIMLG